MIGEHIRLARVTANLTQKEFAEKVGISRTYLGQLEKGIRKPSFDLLEKLSVLVPALRRKQPVEKADSITAYDIASILKITLESLNKELECYGLRVKLDRFTVETI